MKVAVKIYNALNRLENEIQSLVLELVGLWEASQRELEGEVEESTPLTITLALNTIGSILQQTGGTHQQFQDAIARFVIEVQDVLAILQI